MSKFVLKRDVFKLPPQNTSMVRVSLIFVGVALFCLYFSDVSITTLDPWLEIDRMIVGVFTPDFLAINAIGDALLKTVSFAIIGVAMGAVAGFLLAQIFHLRVVRFVCSFVRSIHELFWALIFLQMLGLTPQQVYLPSLYHMLGFAQRFTRKH